MALSVDREGRSRNVRFIAGLDAAFTSDKKSCIGGVVLWDLHSKTVVEHHTAIRKLYFPYIPGLLSFREAPALIDCLRKLENRPDLLICDGQGIAHPRRLGIASHIGLIADLPAIGCAKSRLTGSYTEPGPDRGNKSSLYDKDEVIGAVVRTRDHVRPVFVSVGHKIDLATAVRFVLDSAIGFRLPEPTRLADHLVTEKKRSLRGD